MSLMTDTYRLAAAHCFGYRCGPFVAIVDSLPWRTSSRVWVPFLDRFAAVYPEYQKSAVFSYDEAPIALLFAAEFWENAK